jgi:transposase-like protein
MESVTTVTNKEPIQTKSLETQPLLSCPSCGSSATVKNGLRLLSNGKETQVLKCSDCGQKFSQSYLRFTGQRSKHQISAQAKNLGTITETKTVTSDIKGNS